MLLDHSMKSHQLWIHDHLNTKTKFIEVHQCFFLTTTSTPQQQQQQQQQQHQPQQQRDLKSAANCFTIRIVVRWQTGSLR